METLQSKLTDFSFSRRARRLVTLPFAPIKKLGRSISNSKLASAFFFSGPTSSELETSMRRTRTTDVDTIPEESTIISNVDLSSEAQTSSPGLQRKRSGLQKLLSFKPLKPLKIRRSSSTQDDSR